MCASENDVLCLHHTCDGCVSTNFLIEACFLEVGGRVSGFFFWQSS